jgi:hypothetical protein
MQHDNINVMPQKIMETDNNLQNLFWEENLFEALFEKLFSIYKKFWFVIAALWISIIVLAYYSNSWTNGIIIIFSALFSFPLAAFGHATDKRVFVRGYGNFWGRVARFVYCYLLGTVGYALIILFPLAIIVRAI